MAVVELDGPHPAEPAEHPGQLGAVHAAQLGDPQRQVTMAARARAADQRVVRAQARPQHELLPAHLHRRPHVLGVVGPVARSLVELAFAQDRRVDVLVAVAAFQLVDVVLDRLAHRRAGGQPVGQAGADQRVGVEDAQLAAESAMVVHDHPFQGKGERPGSRASAREACDQRAGTVSGVVVTRARCMRTTIAPGLAGRPWPGFGKATG